MNTITSWGTALWSSLANGLALVFSFIPRLLGFLVILLIGWIIAQVLNKGISLLLRKVGFDRIGDRIGLTRFAQQMNVQMDAASLLGKIVFWFVFLIFLVVACNALGLTTVSSLLNQIIGYLPNVFVAILVLILGLLLASFVYDLVHAATVDGRFGRSNLLANVARYAIIGFTILIALTQLQIAPNLMNTLFTAVIGAVALAFGLAFGLGGRDTAQRLLDRGENTLTTGATTSPMQQQQQRFNQSPILDKTSPSSTINPTPTEQMRRDYTP